MSTAETRAVGDRVFRTRSQRLGGHVHVTVYVAPRPDHTFANCGDLVMSKEDWRSFRAALRAEHIEHE